MGNKRKLIYSLSGLIAITALTSAAIAQTQNRYANYSSSAQHYNQQNYNAQTAAQAYYYQPQYGQASSEHHRHQVAAYRDLAAVYQDPAAAYHDPAASYRDPNPFPNSSPYAYQQNNTVEPPRHAIQRDDGRHAISAPPTFGPRYNQIGFGVRQEGPFGEKQVADPFGEAPPSARDPFGEEQIAPGGTGNQLTDPFADPPGSQPQIRQPQPRQPQTREPRTREPRTREPRTREPQARQGGADPVLPGDADPNLDTPQLNNGGGSILENGNVREEYPPGAVKPDEDPLPDPFKDPESQRSFDEDRYIPPAGVYRPPGSRKRRPAYQEPGRQLDYPQSGYPQSAYQQPGGYQKPGHQQPECQQFGYQQPGYQQPGHQQPGYQQFGYQQPGYQQPAHQQPGYQQPEYQPVYQPIPGHAPAHQTEYTAPPAQQLVITPPPANPQTPLAAQASPANEVYVPAVAPIDPRQACQSCHSDCGGACLGLPSNRPPNFYFSFFGGWSNLADLTSNSGLGDFQTEDGSVFGIALGRRNGRNLRTELELSSRAYDVSGFSEGSSLTPLTGEVTAFSGMANAYWEFVNTPQGLFQPYVGAGVGFIAIDSDINNSDLMSIIAPDSEDDTSLAFQYMVGVNYKAYRNVDLYAEYRYLEADTFRLDTTVGTSDRFSFQAENVILGLRWKF